MKSFEIQSVNMIAMNFLNKDLKNYHVKVGQEKPMEGKEPLKKNKSQRPTHLTHPGVS